MSIRSTCLLATLGLMLMAPGLAHAEDDKATEKSGLSSASGYVMLSGGYMLNSYSGYPIGETGMNEDLSQSTLSFGVRALVFDETRGSLLGAAPGLYVVKRFGWSSAYESDAAGEDGGGFHWRMRVGFPWRIVNNAVASAAIGFGIGFAYRGGIPATSLIDGGGEADLFTMAQVAIHVPGIEPSVMYERGTNEGWSEHRVTATAGLGPLAASAAVTLGSQSDGLDYSRMELTVGYRIVGDVNAAFD